MKTFSLSHVAMSVPPGTLTDEYRSEVSEFYGALFGWFEIEALRLPDRMTISVGHFAYINIRERDEVMHATGYEHFGVLMKSSGDLVQTCEQLARDYPDIEVKGQPTDAGTGTVRFQHLLPLAVEMQFFPDAV